MFSEWLKMAACKGETEAFFSYDEEIVEQARAICEGCQVREQCLQMALTDSNLYGVWGGTTKAERRRMQRQRVA